MRALPKISIITITWNDARGLQPTIESVRRQTYPDYEHHIVDGGSTDGAVEIAAAYASIDSRVLFTSEPDRGIFDAMNKGARRATGEILVFVNSGDALTDPDTLQFVANEWAMEDDWRWGYGAQRLTDSEWRPVGGTIQAPFHSRKFELGLQYIPHASSYVARDLFLSAGAFDEDFGTAADQEVFFRLVRTHPPKVWIRFLSDFLMGGVHTTESSWSRERLWHRMRAKNGVLIANVASLDLIVSWMIAVGRGSRRALGRLGRRLLASAPR